MKSIITVLCTLILAQFTFGQTLTEQLGGIETHFTFTSLNDSIDVKNQILVERVAVHTTISTITNESYAATHNYKSWHFEFMTSTELNSRRRDKTTEKRYYHKYLVKFYNAENVLLTQMYLPKQDVRVWGNGDLENPLITYSIDLWRFPITVLNDLSRVSITYIEL